jgi:hypothetical protein
MSQAEGNGLSAELRADLLRELIARSGALSVTCAGHSMFPSIAMGQQVRVVAADRVETGHVALFRAADELVLHRITLRIPLPSDAILVHAGDATRWRGGITKESNVLACVDAPASEVSFSRSLETAAGALRGRVMAQIRRLLCSIDSCGKVPRSGQ